MRRRVLLAAAKLKAANTMAALASGDATSGGTPLARNCRNKDNYCPPIVERSWKSTFHESVATEIEDSTEFRRIFDGVGSQWPRDCQYLNAANEISRV